MCVCVCVFMHLTVCFVSGCEGLGAVVQNGVHETRLTGYPRKMESMSNTGKQHNKNK